MWMLGSCTFQKQIMRIVHTLSTEMDRETKFMERILKGTHNEMPADSD